MHNTHFTRTAEDTNDIEFLMLCRTRLTAGQVNEIDNRIARHANRIVAERGIDLEDATVEAAAQFGHELRTRISSTVAA